MLKLLPPSVTPTAHVNIPFSALLCQLISTRLSSSLRNPNPNPSSLYPPPHSNSCPIQPPPPPHTHTHTHTHTHASHHLMLSSLSTSWLLPNPTTRRSFESNSPDVIRLYFVNFKQMLLVFFLQIEGQASINFIMLSTSLSLFSSLSLKH